MAIVKVIEVICEGKTIEEAIHSGMQEASKTIKNIRQIDVKWIRAQVENEKIASFRVNAKISFIVQH